MSGFKFTSSSRILRDFLDIVSGNYRTRISNNNNASNVDVELPTTSGKLAIEHPKTTAIQELSTNGLIRNTGPNTVSVQTIGDAGAAVLASSNEAAVQAAAGLGTLSTKNTVTSAEISDGTIIDGDIAANAGIGWTKVNKTGAVASDIGAIPASDKGATNGVATLVNGKVPATQSRGSNVTFTASTGTFEFTWPDGQVQSVNTVLESLFQNVNYNSTTKTITFTRADGSTVDVPISDLADIPEVFIATQNPISNPTTGQRLYLRSDTGEYWINSGSSWSGPFLNITSSERSKLGGIEVGAQVNTVFSVAGKTEAVTLVKGDVGLGSVDNTSDLSKPISTATQTALSAITTSSLGADIAGVKTLTPTNTDPGNAATNSGFLSWLLSAVRGAQTTLAGLGALATKSTIANADVASDAAIAWSKISKSGASPGDIGAATSTQGDKADTALQASSSLDATKLTGTVPSGAIPSSFATETEVEAYISSLNLGTMATRNAISSVDIVDETIVNEDISPNAGIAWSKISPTSRMTSIQAQTAAGLLQLAAGANSSASILTTGAMAGPLLAAGNAAAARTAIGAGTMATQNTDAVAITGGSAIGLTTTESDVFSNTSGQGIFRMTGDINGGCTLRLENRSASNGAVFRNDGVPLVDLRFEAAGTGRTIQMRSEFRSTLSWDGSAAELEFFLDGDAANSRIFSVGVNQTQCYKPLVVRNAGNTANTTIGPGTIRLGAGATLTAMLRATKTLAGTNPETITVTGAAVGDIVELSRSITGEVTAANTVTFNGTGLSGNLVAIVKRYT